MPVPSPGIDRGGAEFLLDLEQPVVLGGALPPHRGAGLDLPGVQPDHQVGDERIFGLADRSDTTMLQPPCTAWRAAASASDSVPAWLTLNSRALAALMSWARCTRPALVTSRSSPTTCASIRLVSSAKAAKSSSWK